MHFLTYYLFCNHQPDHGHLIHYCLIHQADQLYEDHADVDAAAKDLPSQRPPLLLHFDASLQSGVVDLKVS
jgi:hypothetical protein